MNKKIKKTALAIAAIAVSLGSVNIFAQKTLSALIEKKISASKDEVHGAVIDLGCKFVSEYIKNVEGLVNTNATHILNQRAFAKALATSFTYTTAASGTDVEKAYNAFVVNETLDATMNIAVAPQPGYNNSAPNTAGVTTYTATALGLNNADIWNGTCTEDDQQCNGLRCVRPAHNANGINQAFGEFFCTDTAATALGTGDATTIAGAGNSDILCPAGCASPSVVEGAATEHHASYNLNVYQSGNVISIDDMQWHISTKFIPLVTNPTTGVASMQVTGNFDIFTIQTAAQIANGTAKVTKGVTDGILTAATSCTEFQSRKVD